MLAGTAPLKGSLGSSALLSMYCIADRPVAFPLWEGSFGARIFLEGRFSSAISCILSIKRFDLDTCIINRWIAIKFGA